MNRDGHLLAEAYKTIVEQDVSAWKRAAFNLGFNPNLTPEEINKLIYDQKKRDISYGGWKAVQDFNRSRTDKKYSGFATVLPYESDRSPQKIQLDYIQRLDGVKPGEPLSYYNTKNPNWFNQAWSDEKYKEGPFGPNWNYQEYQRSKNIWQNSSNFLASRGKKDHLNDPMSFLEIYKDPFEGNGGDIRDNIAIDNYGNAQTFGKPSIQQNNSGVNSLKNATNQFNAIGVPQQTAVPGR